MNEGESTRDCRRVVRRESALGQDGRWEREAVKKCHVHAGVRMDHDVGVLNTFL